MKNIVPPLFDKTFERLKITRSSILPFTERPDVERSEGIENHESKINATELFSFFTADIIKEKVVFIR